MYDSKKTTINSKGNTSRFLCSNLSKILLHNFIVQIWLYIFTFVKLQVLGLRLGVDFTFTLDNNDNNDNDSNNPHLNFFKGTALGVKEQGLGIRDKA